MNNTQGQEFRVLNAILPLLKETGEIKQPKNIKYVKT